eukprot:14119114-Alexandrium_andersonii.AAC.1
MVLLKSVGALNAAMSLSWSRGPPGRQTLSTDKSRRKKSAGLAWASTALSYACASVRESGSGSTSSKT